MQFTFDCIAKKTDGSGNCAPITENLYNGIFFTHFGSPLYLRLTVVGRHCRTSTINKKDSLEREWQQSRLPRKGRGHRQA